MIQTGQTVLGRRVRSSAGGEKVHVHPEGSPTKKKKKKKIESESQKEGESWISVEKGKGENGITQSQADPKLLPKTATFVRSGRELNSPTSKGWGDREQEGKLF